eukprot:13184331-Alexandrium_andersonii.AAC.1
MADGPNGPVTAKIPGKARQKRPRLSPRTATRDPSDPAASRIARSRAPKSCCDPKGLQRPW